MACAQWASMKATSINIHGYPQSHGIEHSLSSLGLMLGTSTWCWSQEHIKHCLYKRSIHPTAGSSWKDKIVCGMKGQGGLKTCEQGAAACEMARHWALAHEITGYVKWSNAQGTPGLSLFPRFRVSELVQVRSAWCCAHCSLIHEPLT